MTLPHQFSLLEEVRAGTQAGQELGGRREVMKKCCLLTCPPGLPNLLLFIFLIALRTSSSGIASPTMAWALQYQFRKGPTGLPTFWSYRDILSAEVSSSLLTVGGVKLM